MKCHYQIDRVADRANTMTVFIEPENPAEESYLRDVAHMNAMTKGSRVELGIENNSVYVVIPLRFQ